MKWLQRNIVEHDVTIIPHIAVVTSLTLSLAAVVVTNTVTRSSGCVTSFFFKTCEVAWDQNHTHDRKSNNNEKY